MVVCCCCCCCCCAACHHPGQATRSGSVESSKRLVRLCSGMCLVPEAAATFSLPSPSASPSPSPSRSRSCRSSASRRGLNRTSSRLTTTSNTNHHSTARRISPATLTQCDHLLRNRLLRGSFRRVAPVMLAALPPRATGRCSCQCWRLACSWWRLASSALGLATPH